MSKNIKISVDGSLDIAVGKSRRETHWKNKQFLWSTLVNRLSETHRTHESAAEYAGMKKEDQDKIKDVGGFVGGFLTGGRKKAGSVLHRQLITLDIDFANHEFWDDFSLVYSCSAVVYSTHSHTPEKPRLRLLIPLDREVTPEEYEAISRRVAGNLGIEQFDTTTFQPERLMYWPNSSKDAEYIFKYQDGNWLKADDVLNTYVDWQDSSSWPISAKANKVIERGIKKQGDPLEKPGVIGAFCRTYGIAEAIDKYLSDVYDPCDQEDRFTYKEGSTAAGLVVYEDKYAFSHHGTDPVSGKLCNAFDLVRIHLFGLKDEDKDNNNASMEAMLAFCIADPKVKKQFGAERIMEAREDFAEIAESDEEKEEDLDWLSTLEVDKKGNYISSINNIYQVLKHDHPLKDLLYFDEFEGRLIAKKNLPWRKVTTQTRDFTDDDADCLAHYLEAYKIPFTQLPKALAKIRTEYKTHPVRNYLNSLEWDGEERIETLFIDYLGADDNPYTRSATRKTLVAAVARVFEPGVKFDTVLTLVGPEGIGKSTVIAKLGREWFSDCLGDIHTKDGMESLRGIWLMEIAELATFRRADQEAIKRFISSPSDVYRPAYGKQQVKFPRQCIFFATTNKEDFLTGSHGNRRYLPIDTMVDKPTKNVFKHLTSEEVNQIWAEALSYYKKGETLDLEKEIKVLAENVREQHNEVDERAGMIENYLNTLLPENWDELSIHDRRAFLAGDELQERGTVEREYVCVAEVWCEVLGGMQRDLTNNNTKYIHEILRKMKGWKPTKLKTFSIYGRQRAYEKVQKPSDTGKKGRVSRVSLLNTLNTK